MQMNKDRITFMIMIVALQLLLCFLPTLKNDRGPYYSDDFYSTTDVLVEYIDYPDEDLYPLGKIMTVILLLDAAISLVYAFRSDNENSAMLMLLWASFGLSILYFMNKAITGYDIRFLGVVQGSGIIITLIAFLTREVPLPEVSETETKTKTICPACGHAHAVKVLTCLKCGGSIAEAKPQRAENVLDEEFSVVPQVCGEGIKCPVCGTVQAKGRKRCWDCGTRFDVQCDDPASGT